MSNTNNITNPVISKLSSSPPNASTTISIPKPIVNGGKRKKNKSKKRRKYFLGGDTVAVNNIPYNSVSPQVEKMYQQVNQAQVTNSIQSMTDGGRRRRKKSRKRRRRKSRRRDIY